MGLAETDPGLSRRRSVGSLSRAMRKPDPRERSLRPCCERRRLAVPGGNVVIRREDRITHAEAVVLSGAVITGAFTEPEEEPGSAGHEGKPVVACSGVQVTTDFLDPTIIANPPYRNRDGVRLRHLLNRTTATAWRRARWTLWLYALQSWSQGPGSTEHANRVAAAANIRRSSRL